MARDGELRALGATLVGEARTAADYRLFVLPDTRPAKPGLVRVPGFAGPGIAIEIWSLDPAAFGRFVEKIPAPLGIGKVRLDVRSEEHKSELQSLMRISYAVLCLKKKHYKSYKKLYSTIFHSHLIYIPLIK